MTPEEIPNFHNACIVVAHPDDEVLWFSSIVRRVARTFICFVDCPTHPDRGDARRSALMKPPLDIFTSLNLEEAGVFSLACWPDPDTTPEGVALTRAGYGDARHRRYRENFTCLTDMLCSQLAGFDLVFTHSPWGEYGHEEHVQVYRAVRAVQDRLGFQVWCSAYFGARSLGLMTRCLEGTQPESFSLEPDAGLARQVAAIYKEHHVWTWHNDYVWPSREHFLRFNGGNEITTDLEPVPLCYLEGGRARLSFADRTFRSLARRACSLLPFANLNTTPPV